MPAIAKAFNTLRRHSTAFPAFSGLRGQITHIGSNVGDAYYEATGTRITEEAALRIAACWIAVTIISDEVGTLTQKIVLRDDNNRVLQRPSQLESFWGISPNPIDSAVTLATSETLSMCLAGFSTTMLGWRRNGDLGVRWAIDPTGVALELIDEETLKLTSSGQGELYNRPGQLPEFEYCPMFVMPGKVKPVSAVEFAASHLGLSAAYDKMAIKFAGRGFSPAAILTVGESVDEDIAAALSKRLERLHGGAGNAGGVAVIGGENPKLEKLTMSMADAAFVATYKAVFQVVMALWRVPPTVAGMAEVPSTWGAGIAEFSRGLQLFTLRPYVERRQQAKTRYIVQPVDSRLQVRYPFDSLLSATPKERTQVQQQRLQYGMTSVERVQAQNDEPPFTDDETVYTQLALATESQREARIALDAANAVGAQANAVASLIAAGVDRDRAFAILGEDPARVSDTIKAIREEQIARKDS